MIRAGAPPLKRCPCSAWGQGSLSSGGRTNLARDFSPWMGRPLISFSSRQGRRATRRSSAQPGGLKPLATNARPPGEEHAPIRTAHVRLHPQTLNTYEEVGHPRTREMMAALSPEPRASARAAVPELTPGRTGWVARASASGKSIPMCGDPVRARHADSTPPPLKRWGTRSSEPQASACAAVPVSTTRH
jgi:hypothetical protein